ncbi:hypothetical protein CHLRE_04g211599v5 [Chlamydomonas reinhardtii]|uniref:Uncharacterized protein n=1 Tax=Chlamydomonas reinhardtii TaxID=3055 RepID=A0A2K3DU05_CHLRE|nr:uncharacterized protein CHLRE_04g211599v5 [Chlamydomonas reinhardtii]PNW84018.1 hypothetical protein CHLRE_04g211599v5 [Chlamydomonas reinhardtii]
MQHRSSQGQAVPFQATQTQTYSLPGFTAALRLLLIQRFAALLLGELALFRSVGFKGCEKPAALFSTDSDLGQQQQQQQFVGAERQRALATR